MVHGEWSDFFYCGIQRNLVHGKTQPLCQPFFQLLTEQPSQLNIIVARFRDSFDLPGDELIFCRGWIDADLIGDFDRATLDDHRDRPFDLSVRRVMRYDF